MTVEWVDLYSCMPALILTAGALFLLAADLLTRQTVPRALLVGTAFLFTLLALIGTALFIQAPESEWIGFRGAVALDGLSLFMTVVVLIETLLALPLSSNLSERFPILLSEYLALILLSSSGMIFLILSTDLVTMFLSLEIVSLALYVLTGVTRRLAPANEASMKYFVIGSVGSAFLVYGMVLLYGSTGSFFLQDIAVRTTQAMQGGPGPAGISLAGLGFVLVGFAFKVGAVPFHTWVPDVYEGAPTAVTAFMSVSVKAAAFAALLRTLLRGLPSDLEVTEVWTAALAAIAVVTMAVGNLLAIGQESVKRMLAYSSIAHTGYALIGVVVAGSLDPSLRVEAVAATSFYLLAYTFMTFGAFAVLMWLGAKERDAERFDDFRGLSQSRPWAAFVMTVFLVSLAGIPPTGGFFGKFYIFKVAIEGGYAWLAVVAIVTTIVSVYYYLRVVVYMYMQPKPEAQEWPQADKAVGSSIAVAALCTVLLGVAPGKCLALGSELIQRWLPH